MPEVIPNTIKEIASAGFDTADERRLLNHLRSDIRNGETHARLD